MGAFGGGSAVSLSVELLETRTEKHLEFELVTEREFGLTIEETDRETIAEAIRDLYGIDAEKRERMGTQGREYVLENHTWQTMVRQILADLP